VQDPAPVVTALRETPRTFIHTDWKGGNLGLLPSGRTVLVDWAFPGEGAGCSDLAWYLAVNCDRLPASKEATIEAYRGALERLGVETAPWFERQLDVALLGAFCMLGWSKTSDPVELGWWVERGGAGGVSFTDDIRRAYDGAGESWCEGPATVYRALARPVLDAVRDVAGQRVVDVGTGSGVLADELVRRGAGVLALDLSLGMLRRAAAQRPPAVVADARALPLQAQSVDLVLASFVLNHLDEPARAASEALRVLRPGGRLLATTFEGAAGHPVKDAVDAVTASYGYVAPAWYAQLKGGPVLGTAEELVAAATGAGFAGYQVRSVPVRLDLAAEEIAEWRLGMAQVAGFVAALPAQRRAALHADASAAVAAVSEALVLRVLLLEAVAP
jgi:SAM-dependent methyltransferase